MYLQIACLNRCKITLAAFVCLFPTVRFRMCSQMACTRRGKVTLVAFVWLFPTVHFQMCSQNYTGCIDMAFLQCVFSYASSNCLHAMMQSHTGCTFLAFLSCVYFSYVSSLLLPMWMKSYIGNICLALLSPALSEWRDEGSCIFPFSNNCKSTLMTSTRREEKGPMNIPKRGFAHGLKCAMRTAHCASIHPSIHQ